VRGEGDDERIELEGDGMPDEGGDGLILSSGIVKSDVVLVMRDPGL